MSRPRSTRAGFSIVEIVLVAAIASIALAMFARIVSSAARLDPQAMEQALAAEAARTALEQLRRHPPDQVVALYNDDPSDDPEGAGTAPGAGFDVLGLIPLAVDGTCGRIEIPWSAGELREDFEDAALGLPRDLDGDGLIDELDHAANWILLPVRVRVEWYSPTARGPRSFALHTMLARL